MNPDLLFLQMTGVSGSREMVGEGMAACNLTEHDGFGGGSVMEELA